MSTHTDAQEEKRRAAAQAAAEKPGIDPMALQDSTAAYWQKFMNASEECARFSAKRAHRYQRFFHDLSACETPVDAVKLYTEAAQTMVKDYVEEASRMAELVQSSMGANGVTPSKITKKG